MWPFDPKPPADFPPKPKWKPNLPVDHAAIIAAFDRYTDGNGHFVVFQQGTFVPVDPESEAPGDEAKAILDEIFHQHPDFNPLHMDDGNWMVSMSKAAFVICLAEEVEQNWDYIQDNHLEGLATEEVLINAEGNANVFDGRAMIGLFGRARWFMDAQSPIIHSVHMGNSG